MKNASLALLVAIFICGAFAGGVIVYAVYASRTVPVVPATSVASKTSTGSTSAPATTPGAPVDLTHQGIVSKVDASGVTIVFPDLKSAAGTTPSVMIAAGDTSATFTASVPNTTSGSVSTPPPTGTAPPPQAPPPGSDAATGGSTTPQPIAAPKDSYKTIAITESDLKVNDVVEVGLRSTTGDIGGATVTSVKWIGAMVDDGSSNGSGIPTISTQDRFTKK